MALLGVNIDHIANIREARKTVEPDPVQFAFLAELGGADSITVHLREDRRHIQDRDLFLLKKITKIKLNLEMAATSEMTKIAKEVSPDYITLVPEKRNEVTTEGGLDLITKEDYYFKYVKELKESNITLSAFIDPINSQIDCAKSIGFHCIELHTGTYANSTMRNQYEQLQKIIEASYYASDMDLLVNAGHGLNYQNVAQIAKIKNINELNIGHSIVSRALAVGLEQAVREMKNLISEK